VIHPEHGSYQVDVHCLRSKSGSMTLVVFCGVPSYEQAPLVRRTARALGDTVEQLSEEDISEDIAWRLAAEFHLRDGRGVVVMPVQRPNGATS
jgi:hypothetical protein